MSAPRTPQARSTPAPTTPARATPERDPVRRRILGRLAELKAAGRSVSLAAASREMGRHDRYLSDFLGRKRSPRKLDEDDRRRLARYLELAEGELREGGGFSARQETMSTAAAPPEATQSQDAQSQAELFGALLERLDRLYREQRFDLSVAELGELAHDLHRELLRAVGTNAAAYAVARDSELARLEAFLRRERSAILRGARPQHRPGLTPTED